MDWISDNVWFILFVVWGLPLTFYRSNFRKIVYKTDSWLINIKPLFIKEIKALLINIYPKNMKYKRFRKFYGFYLIVYVLLFIVYLNVNANPQKMEKIVVGSKIPKFELLDQNGKIFNIDSVIGKKNLVIYFYPKDDSPGCTKQACSFRDQFEVFKDAGAIIIGISEQSVESHLEFANKHRLNYTLLSDKNNKLRKKFGVPDSLFGFLPGRVTYIVDKKGDVVYIFNSQMKAKEHVTKSLKIIKTLK